MRSWATFMYPKPAYMAAIWEVYGSQHFSPFDDTFWKFSNCWYIWCSVFSRYANAAYPLSATQTIRWKKQYCSCLSTQCPCTQATSVTWLLIMFRGVFTHLQVSNPKMGATPKLKISIFQTDGVHRGNWPCSIFELGLLLYCYFGYFCQLFF